MPDPAALLDITRTTSHGTGYFLFCFAQSQSLPMGCVK